MTQDSASQVAIEKWEAVRQSLGDIYFGREVEKAYRLSWRAIAPHVPGPGEAGRVELASVVSPFLRSCEIMSTTLTSSGFLIQKWQTRGVRPRSLWNRIASTTI